MSVTFQIEKPMRLHWGTTFLNNLKMENYQAEVKMDEDRGFLTLEADGFSFVSHRGIKPHVRKYDPSFRKDLKFPDGTVLDCGHIFSTSIGYSVFYVFDVLLIAGERVMVPLWERRKLLEDAFPAVHPVFWLSVTRANPLRDFQKALDGNKELALAISYKFGAESTKIEPLVEGFVLKKLTHVHSFPTTLRETSDFFKLRFEDLPRAKRSKLQLWRQK